MAIAATANHSSNKLGSTDEATASAGADSCPCDGRISRDASGERRSSQAASPAPDNSAAVDSGRSDADSPRPRLVMRNGQQYGTRCLAYYCDHAQELDFEWFPEDEAVTDAAITDHEDNTADPGNHE
jgi:hypothetical protein